MDVEMKHRLPRARTHVHHGPVSLLDVALPRDLGRCQATLAYHFGVLSLRLFQPGKMFSWDDQHMRRCLRIAGFKGKHMLVLVNFLRGNLAANNAAEKAISCVVSHSGRWSLVVGPWQERSTLIFHHEEAEKTNRLANDQRPTAND